MNDYIKKILDIPKYDLNQAYSMGYDCGLNGANTTNCHFGIFSSKENTKAWENGKRDAEKNLKKSAGEING